jgi:hypothetical protein
MKADCTAFPIFSEKNGAHVLEPGLSKRELYAAFSMMGIKANNDLWKAVMEAAKELKKPQQELLAVMAFKDADAMIAESEKKEPTP